MPTYGTHLTAHFIAGELGADRAPVQYLANIQRTADYLEIVRSIAGVPLGKVSGWRSPQRNEQADGSESSSHLVGLASDFTPLGRTSFAVYNDLKRAKALGKLPTFDQIIYYPFGHLHVGLGPRNRNEFRIRIREQHYALDTTPADPLGADLTSGQMDAAALLALGFIALVLLFGILA